MTGIVSALENLLASIFGVFRNLLLTFLSVFQSIGAVFISFITGIFGLAKDLVGFFFNNVVVLLVLVAAAVGYAVYQQRQGRPVTIPSSKGQQKKLV
ncbi:MAG: hypothetical protein M1829_004525 [Trizodia sp. TS-e1964]|nr:MAG: hypothetical protein M1829_004525 [Trizodia sp. TS-e1964]